MRTKILIPATALLSFFMILTLLIRNTTGSSRLPLSTKKITKLQRIKDAIEEDFSRTKDPILGYPPKDRLRQAIVQTKNRQQESWFRDDITLPRWIEQGPNNIGGRTRTIMIDLNDSTRNTIWVGGVSGGLWKCENITATPPNWQNMSAGLNNLFIGALAQDPNNHQIMYLGTGEGLYNYNLMTGNGVYKSIDAGETWTYLESTDIPQMNTIQAILVHPTGDVYVAARSGLYRSQDDGETWKRVRTTFIWDLELSTDGFIYASVNRSVYKSETGNLNDWTTLIGHGFPHEFSRVEFSVSKSNPEIIYAIGNDNYEGSAVYKTTDRGATWQRLSRPSGGDYTNGQAWYDLEIAVDPFDPNHVIVGGVRIYHSFDGGQSWQVFANNMHVDQHKILFDSEKNGVIYFGNDGGIWRSENGSAPLVESKNNGYNITQFYAGAIHPEAHKNYFLGGTQDNNSLKINREGISGATIVWGGDGFYCHIDEDEPNIQLVSSQYGNYGLSTDGGATFSWGEGLDGSFYCPSDYDDETNILYAQTNHHDFVRWDINTFEIDYINIPDYDIDATTVFVDPNTPNRVYFGSSNGKVIKVDNANTNISATRIFNSYNTTVSSIDVEYGNPDHLLITLSNYGIDNSVVESTDGGDTWQSVEGIDIDNNLPDIPVRWAVFNPNNADQAVIATELGIWTTDLLRGDSTHWDPPLLEPEGGIPLVRTDMLLTRKSDHVILAATYGRGLFTTNAFAEPLARIDGPLVHYVDAPFLFKGDVSYGASSWFWDFGDGTTANIENPFHAYSDIGEYEVSLTINDSVSTTSTIKILPKLALPYTGETANYGGDFENFDEHFGSYKVSGSPFEKGQSAFSGKNGTHSGDNAYVLDLTNHYYLANTESYLYTPMFDFSDNRTYEFSFWAKFQIHYESDGLIVQYSTDRGRTWSLLGDESEDWYNFTNTNPYDDIFPHGSSYFTGGQNTFKQYSQDVSFLAGNEDVAFRFFFQSRAFDYYPGVVIDDISILKSDEEPVSIVRHEDTKFAVQGIAPNPFVNRIELFFTDRINLPVSYELFSLSGLQITKGRIMPPDNYYSFDVPAIPNGIYFLKIKVDNQDSQVFKLIKVNDRQ